MFYLPNTKLSGLKICPKGPDLTESMVPGSKSTRMALGTYLPPTQDREEEKRKIISIRSYIEMLIFVGKS